ncbi:hypothetical protein CC99x_004475 [Candidatus Berkiella cookevillensis]|uniref:Uncharacterized protein n=1 Tax=Candidatus Berkiella cookevillensis TaxID=437022 RepID=A0A0Q9YQX3_9GAMM|nr:hypothetical protein [Candidatus Berkiella cookevillensis]MCS5708153.1 hypothetical protein [Candidatus Berkiella cookevillensis]
MLSEQIAKLRSEIEEKNQNIAIQQAKLLKEIKPLRDAELAQIANDKAKLLTKIAPYAKKMARKHSVQFDETNLAPFITNVRAHLSFLQQRKIKPLLQTYGQLLQTESGIDNKYSDMLNNRLATLQAEVDQLDASLTQLNHVKSLVDNPTQFLNNNILNMIPLYSSTQINAQMLANNLSKINTLFSAIQAEDFNPEIVSALEKMMTTLAGQKAMNDYLIEGNNNDIELMQQTKQTTDPRYKIMQDENVRKQRENEAINAITKNLTMQLEHQKQLATTAQHKSTAASSTSKTSNSPSDKLEKTTNKKHHHSHKNKAKDEEKTTDKKKGKSKHHAKHTHHQTRHEHKRKASRSPSPSIQSELKQSRPHVHEENILPNTNPAIASPVAETGLSKATTIAHQYQASRQNNGDRRVQALIQLHQDAINRVAEDADKGRFRKK